MKRMYLIPVLLTVLALAVYAFVVRSKGGGKTEHHDVPYGPFIVRSTSTTGKSFNLNYGMVSGTTVRQTILYKGEPVAFPEALQTNTGLPFLWRVYALQGPKEPTLLAGSQSLYLVFEREGQAVVEPILEQGTDFASLQFLDGDGGQPGERTEVYMHNDPEDTQKLDTLQGGRFLLVSDAVVIDLNTMQRTAFKRTDYSNYSALQQKGALAFSPDQRTIVYPGWFNSYNTENKDLPETEGALLAFEYASNTGYAVPYNDTDTRVTSQEEVNRAWFETYFEWTPDHKLRLKQLDKPMPWKGRYVERDNYYYLYPVKASMVPVFQDFVMLHMQWDKSAILKDETGEYTGRRIDLGSGAVKLDIGYQEDDQRLSFSKHLYDEDTPEYRTLVKKLADAFDAELASGKYQEHFGRVENETRKIRGE